ncbi:MAG: HlyD family efflux transporter periplasmic adaptor subunit [Reyranellaceae bacterium]
MVAALSLLAVAGHALLGQIVDVTADQAVVSAYTAALRSPIAGEVAGLDSRPGDRVVLGDGLASVRDPRAERRELVDLLARRSRLDAEIAATEATLADFEAMRRELAARGAHHAAIAKAWYAAQIAEAERLLEAVNARITRAARDLDRKERLIAAGATTAAELDAARLNHTVARQEAAAHQARIAALVTQHDGIDRGFFVEAGHNGSSYAQQRIDEIALRLTELRRVAASLRAEHAALAGPIAEAERSARQQQTVLLTAPITGQFWRRLATPGERVTAGQPVVEVVDCAGAFLLAVVSQSEGAGIRPGDRARYRMSGDTADHVGRVEALLGDATSTERGNLAAVPGAPRGGVLLRIALDGSETAASGSVCPVGRTARVVLDGRGSGLLGRAWAATRG